MADVRIAIRRLAARPAYTLLILTTLALGIGAATAVFSVVDQTILRPAPFPHAERLVDVMHIHSVTRSGGSSLTPRKILGWQEQTSVFERLEGAAPVQMDVTGSAEPERLNGLQVSLGLFPMLDARPLIGRTFGPGDGAPGSEPVVIISDAVWRKRFGGRADVLGERMLLNDVPHIVIGVMPRRFRLLGEDAFWLPVDLQARIDDASFRGYGIGRLAPGVAPKDAQALADQVATRLQQEMPIAQTWGLGIEKKLIARVDETTRTALLVLLGAVGFVLLITCANVASLFLSQAPARAREMAIRSALGAGRPQLVRSVLVESLLLAVAGGVFGIVLARWGVDAILAAAPQRMVSMSTTPIEIDARVLAVAAALTLVTGFIFGLLPALRGSRPNLETTLRSGGQRPTRGAYGRLPAGLVVVEVAFAVVLLVGAALMTRTLVNLNAIDPGFRPDGLVAMHVALPSDRYPTTAARLAFFDTLDQKLRGIGPIRDVALSQGTPPSIGGISFGRPEIEGRGTPDADIVVVPNGTVSPSYFRTMGIPLVAGRNFEPNEAEGHVIVSQAFANRYWPDGNAVGGRFRMATTWPWNTVIGVVGSVQASAGTDRRTDLQFYHPWVARPAASPTQAPSAPGGAPSPSAQAPSASAQAPSTSGRAPSASAQAPSASGRAPSASAQAPSASVPSPRRAYGYRQIIVRADNPLAVVPLVKEQIWSVDPHQPVERVALVADSYGEMFAKQRFVLLLMSAFSLLALIVTAAGIFGVLSQAVAQRTREIGIRMALGAKPWDVMSLVLSRGMLLTAIGAAIGVAGALSLVKTVQALLYGIQPTDPASFAAVLALLGIVGLAACWLPTRAAMRVDPAVALRAE
ncbi:MAG TPA: ABC transporter permease [Vicinamibacterales bacterium]|nr:ABC transporter permease [Vicinamibacterales bacterium]